MLVLKNRILWVDYAKAFAIYCIILLHVGIPDPYKGFIRVFIIPLFFFLSGLFSNFSRYENFKSFFLQKGLKILIPYLFFNIVTYLFWVFIGRHYGLDKTLEIPPLRPIVGILLGKYEMMQHYVPLWFLACLLSVESIYFLVSKFLKKRSDYFITIIIFMLLGFINYQFNPYSLPWGIDIALTMIVFYVSGNMLKNEVLDKQVYTFRFIIISIISFLIVWTMSKMNDEVKVFTNYFGNYLYFYIGAFGGIALTVYSFKLFESLAKKQLKFLAFIGQNTLIILSLHLIASSLLKGILLYVLNINFFTLEHSVLYSILFGFSLILLLIPVIIILNKYLPFVVGRGKIYENFKK